MNSHRWNFGDQTSERKTIKKKIRKNQLPIARLQASAQILPNHRQILQVEIKKKTQTFVLEVF